MIVSKMVLNGWFLWLFSLLFLGHGLLDESACPVKCICRSNPQRDGADYLKMSCGEDGPKIDHLDELELLNLASELVQLNLSENNLKTFQPKVELIVLQKLNLSGNQITELTEFQFRETPNLRRLDISANGLKQIDIKAFANLYHLEKLRLNHNSITTIPSGTFDNLPNLRQLDISSNPLQCDCSLLWLIDFSTEHDIKLISNPKCNNPPTFKGHPLRKLKVGVDIHCKSPVSLDGLPFIDLKPRANQILFDGDFLKMHCRAPSISDSINDSKLDWWWFDKSPKPYFNDISIVTDFLPSHGLVDSTLAIKQLRKSHSGLWTCMFSSQQGNYSKTIEIMVVSKETTFCEMTSTTNNKGSYSWPKTVANITVALPCESLNLNYNVSNQIATYFCSENATWLNLDTSRCSYISDNTKILQQFSIVNSSILESARHFKNYTSNLSIFKDVMDLVYTIETIDNYSVLQPSEMLSNILIDVVNNLMYLSWDYVRKTDIEYEICRELTNATERMASWSSAVLFQRENLIVEAFPVTKNTSPGLKCSWYVNPSNRFDSLFSCSTNGLVQDTAILQGKQVEASIVVPENMLAQAGSFGTHGTDFYAVISMFANSKFFPMETERNKKEGISSSVVGLSLVGLDHVPPATAHPVIVTLKTPPSLSYEVVPFTPAVWDPVLGQWSTHGCRLGHHLQDHIVFMCHRIGYYGLLQDVRFMPLKISATGHFQLSHPAIYAGNLILFMSMLTATLTYIFGFVAIQMPKKAKHCLINTWISISALCYVYSFGIYQTEDQKLCQIIGLVLHYLSLCSILWVCVTLNSMYKRLTKNGDSILQEDDLPSEPPLKKPVLGLYLVGWGVALIVCGLSAAINIQEYSSTTHCFLRTGPAMSALYVPFTILLLFIFIFFLLIRCAVYNLDLAHGGHLSEGTQATEHVDLDLLEPSTFPQGESRSVRSVSSKTASSEMEDNERSPSAQLKAHAIFFCLYLITWLSCAFATVPPLKMVSFEAELFSYAYAIACLTLSAFTLFFYCLARNDVRSSWFIHFRIMRRKKLFRSHTVSDTQPRLQIQPLPLPPVPNSELRTVSRSSSRSSGPPKTASMKEGPDLNGSLSDRPSLVGGVKINNVNLVALHRAQYRSTVVPHIIENPTNAAVVFYNPHQSTVARRFFRRQRRDMLKRTNLLTRPPRDVNSDATSVISEPTPYKNRNADLNCMFGTNSKVNNTNIHVEKVKKCQNTNPNIFSDSAEDLECMSDIGMGRIVINADKLRRKGKTHETHQVEGREQHNYKIKKKSNIHDVTNQNPMRTVSQQCTLEYNSSENCLSDSILDKEGPLSPILPIRPLNVIQTDASPKQQEKDNTAIFSASLQTPETTVHFSTRRENSPVESSHHYAEIDELRSEMDVLETSERERDRRLYAIEQDCYRGRNEKVFDRFRPFSRTSSVSATDIDELYQQIRRGPAQTRTGKQQSHAHRHAPRSYSSPFLSDSEATGFFDFRKNYREYVDGASSSAVDVETTV